MSLSVWWLFVVTETILSLSPGPAVLFVVSQSLRAGFWRGLWGALGIVSANVVWFALSALGIGAVLLAEGNWFFAIKWLGAAYLVYLAIKPLVGRSHVQEGAAEDSEPIVGGWRVMVRGLLLQMANPKALVFFVALLPQFIDPRQGVGFQVFVLGVTSITCELPVLAVYAALAARGRQWARREHFATALDLLAGVLLIIAALGVALAGDSGSKSGEFSPMDPRQSTLQVESP